MPFSKAGKGTGDSRARRNTGSRGTGTSAAQLPVPVFLLSHESRGQAGPRMAASASPRGFYGRIKAGTGRATNGSKCQSPVFRNVQPAPTRLVTRIVFDSGTSLCDNTF